MRAGLRANTGHRVITFALLVGVVVYVWLLWGPAWGPPAKLDSAPSAEQVHAAALRLTINSFVFGFLVPGVVLRLAGLRLADAGIGLPNLAGLRLGVFFAFLCVPVGFWMAARVPNPWGTPLFETLELLSMIPEHFMIFGITLALMLPARRLPRFGPISIAGPELFAILVAAALFLLVHLGNKPALEVLLATPIGLVFAYLTLVTGSIWPALAVHWALNLLPMAWHALRST